MWAISILKMAQNQSSLAQLAERAAVNRKVVGSKPTGGDPFFLFAHNILCWLPRQFFPQTVYHPANKIFFFFFFFFFFCILVGVGLGFCVCDFNPVPRNN